jgi:hypothetical protein
MSSMKTRFSNRGIDKAGRFILEDEKMSYRLLWRAIRSAAVLVWFCGHAQAGFIEFCKDASPADSLSGLATFAIAGQSGTVAVPVGACSSAIQLPNGLATITELPQIGTILLSVSTFPNDRLISFDLATESAVVLIVPGDISTETVVTFTNAPVAGVPEPGTGWLFGLGLTCWALGRKPLNRGILHARNRHYKRHPPKGAASGT